MQARMETSIVAIFETDDQEASLEKLLQNSEACESWDVEGNTCKIHLIGPVEANEKLLSEIEAL